ncbi:1184_t:CDS:1, partial [Dentiscutata heterogama]
VESLESACDIMKNILSDNHADIPYALIYFVENKLNYDGSESLIARLITTTFDEDGKKERHFPDYFPETHEIIDLTNDFDIGYDNYINLKR